MTDSIRRHQQSQWTEKLIQHGDQPQAVGSESDLHKQLRYGTLLRLIPALKELSLLDVGCGVGGFYEYLQKHAGDKDFQYTGVEITPGYVEQAKAAYPQGHFIEIDITEKTLPKKYDVVVLSGVFHQLFDTPPEAWKLYMNKLLEKSFASARVGIAFNLLSSYADFQKKGNYHRDFAEMTDFIVDNLSRFFVVNHAVPLFEHSIFVYTKDFIASQYQQPELRRYLE